MTDGPFSATCRIHGATNIHEDAYTLENSDKSPTFRPFQHNLPHCSPEVHRTCWCVNFIAEHTRLKEDSTKVTPYAYERERLTNGLRLQVDTANKKLPSATLHLHQQSEWRAASLRTFSPQWGPLFPASVWSPAFEL